MSMSRWKCLDFGLNGRWGMSPPSAATARSTDLQDNVAAKVSFPIRRTRTLCPEETFRFPGSGPSTVSVFPKPEPRTDLFDFRKLGDLLHGFHHARLHGVYCVVAVTACLEAVANRLAFDASGKHSAASESGTALGRINFAARRIASERGVTFNGLGGKRPEAVFAERIRLLRNSFVHANESGAPVNITHLTSDQMASVNEDACRGFLANVRLTIAFVFDQIPWVTKPLVTATKVKWLGEIEVP